MKKTNKFASMGFAVALLFIGPSFLANEAFGQEETVDEDYKKPISLNPGDPALNFRYVDQHGDTVSMSDFKGKVVLIDVWSSWCAPCIALFPYLEKLEKEIDHPDLVVLGVSLDEEKEDWEGVLKNKNVGGIQLFAGGYKEFGWKYAVKRIPKYMVFDREGNIVTVDAPRPSSPALKTLLEETLSQ